MLPAPSGGWSTPQIGAPSLRLVHRLDKHVSGVLITARNRKAAEVLSAVFKADSETVAAAACATSDSTSNSPSPGAKLYKQYVGLVAGPLPPGVAKEGMLTHPVVQEETDEKGNVVRTELPASTTYSVPYSSPSLSLVLLWPASGRKHQLRQHVQHLFAGQGLMGDKKYGGKVVAGQDGGIALHCSAMKIPSQTLGMHQRRDITAVDPLPSRMRDVIIKAGVPAPALTDIGAPQEPICCVPQQSV